MLNEPHEIPYLLNLYVKILQDPLLAEVIKYFNKLIKTHLVSNDLLFICFLK